MKIRDGLLILTLLFFFSFPLIAQQDENESSTESATEEETSSQQGGQASSGEATQKKDSITEERKKVLQFGIDKEIIELIGKLKSEENTRLAEDVLSVFENSFNEKLLVSILDFFEAIEYRKAEEIAYNKLKQWEELGSDLITSLIRYLDDGEEQKYFDVMQPITEHENNAVAKAAIAGLGASGDKKYVSYLDSLLNDPEYPSEVKPNIILALGKLEAKESTETLIEIVEDETESVIWRQYACDALGRIQDPRAIDVLKQTTQADQALLRAYAVYGLSLYPDPEVIDILIEALKDSFWKVRVRAAEGLAKHKATKAIPILEYKAKKDPEEQVRTQAIEALGQIGGSKAFSILRDLYTSYEVPLTSRLAALDALVENDLAGSTGAIKEVLQKEWDRPRSTLLERTCRVLSRAESPALKDVYKLMLDHDYYIIKIYALRGIQKNNFSGLKDVVKPYTQDEVSASVRKVAISVMESL
jgi:HEAT repeat protein